LARASASRAVAPSAFDESSVVVDQATAAQMSAAFAGATLRAVIVTAAALTAAILMYRLTDISLAPLRGDAFAVSFGFGRTVVGTVAVGATAPRVLKMLIGVPFRLVERVLWSAVTVT